MFFMRRAVLLSCLALVLLLTVIAAVPAALAQMLMPQYNWMTYTRFAASVESVNTLQNPKSGMFGLHLFARDASATLYLVHICPQWYADNHPDQFAFKQGDQLIISGSRFTTGLTANNILAASIVNCSQNYVELHVRDPYTGQGLWHNQPDNLVERIQEIQKKLFAERSEAVRRSMEQNFYGSAANAVMVPSHLSIPVGYASPPALPGTNFFWF
jgi:hypothetical protein